MAKFHPLDVRNADTPASDSARKPWQRQSVSPAIDSPVQTAPDRTGKRAIDARARAAEQDAYRSVGWLRFIWAPAMIYAGIKAYRAGQTARGNSPFRAVANVGIMIVLYFALMSADVLLGINALLSADADMLAYADETSPLNTRSGLR